MKKDDIYTYHLYIFLMVGMTGFEPVLFCSQSRRDNQATLHPERPHILGKVLA